MSAVSVWRSVAVPVTTGVPVGALFGTALIDTALIAYSPLPAPEVDQPMVTEEAPARVLLAPNMSPPVPVPVASWYFSACPSLAVPVVVARVASESMTSSPAADATVSSV